MLKFLIRSIALAMAPAIVGSAAAVAQPVDLQPVDTLMRLLQRQGATVERGPSQPRRAYPFFSVDARTLVVQGEDVHVFSYANMASAEADAARVSSSGTSVGGAHVDWIDVPHFYKRGRIIVLYVGHSADVLARLESALGPPFAQGR